MIYSELKSLLDSLKENMKSSRPPAFYVTTPFVVYVIPVVYAYVGFDLICHEHHGSDDDAAFVHSGLQPRLNDFLRESVPPRSAALLRTCAAD